MSRSKILIVAASLICQFPAFGAPAALPDYGRGATPAQRRALEQQIEVITKRLNVSEAALRAIARAVRSANPAISIGDLVRAVAEQAQDLVRLSGIVKDLQGQLAEFKDPAVRDPGLKALRDAQRALDEGRLDDAEKALSTLQYLRHSEGLAAQLAWLNAVRARAAVARLAQKFDKATDLLLEAEADERTLRWESEQRSIQLLLEAAESQFQKGRLTADRAALLKAESILQRVLIESHGKVVLEFAVDYYTALGLIYYDLAELDGNLEYFRRAIRADQAAVALISRDQFPYQWAIIQNSIGNALISLGRREGDVSKLEDAVKLLQSVLSEFSRERYPVEWAGVNFNIGNALSEIGTQRRELDTLRRAVDAYQLAMLEQSRASFPDDWAHIQTNLGTTLRTLSEIEGSFRTLRRSIAAYRDALGIFSRTRTPRDWMVAKNGLAGSLRILGQASGDPRYIREAIGFYDEVLRELTKDRAPGMWALITLNRALAIAFLAQLLNNSEMLDDAARLANDARSFAEARKQGDAVQASAIVLEQISHIKKGIAGPSRE